MQRSGGQSDGQRSVVIEFAPDGRDHALTLLGARAQLVGHMLRQQMQHAGCGHAGERGFGAGAVAGQHHVGVAAHPGCRLPAVAALDALFLAHPPHSLEQAGAFPDLSGVRLSQRTAYTSVRPRNSR